MKKSNSSSFPHFGTKKINEYTNEADGSAYEGVKVATSSVDVGLSSGTTVPPRHTAEQDGLSNHYLRDEWHVRANMFNLLKYSFSPSLFTYTVPSLNQHSVFFIFSCNMWSPCEKFCLSEAPAISVWLFMVHLLENVGSFNSCSFSSNLSCSYTHHPSTINQKLEDIAVLLVSICPELHLMETIII